MIDPSTVVGEGPRLKDLAEAEFDARYHCDRFTATVLSNRFAYVIDNMKDQLIRTAFSPIVRLGDFAVGLSGPPSLTWAMAAVSQTIPLHVGSIPDAVRIVLEEYGLENLEPGDVIVCNDYFRVGTHLNDAVFIRPMFVDGELMGAMTIRCHQIDMGGRGPGGFIGSKRDRYEDGLAIPPFKLYSRGDEVKEVIKLFMANTRFGTLLYPDIRSIVACLTMGETLIGETIQKYGREAYLGGIRYTDDVSAETMADALERLPDGEYDGEYMLDSDYLPKSPEYRIKVRLNKRGRRAEVDLSGSSVASRSALNSAWPDARTGIVIGLKALIDRSSRYTSGSLRPIDVVLPPDSIVNPSYPHACQYYFEVSTALIAAIFNTLNPVLGREAVACDPGFPNVGSVSGTTDDGLAEMLQNGGLTLDTMNTGSDDPWGASRHGDGGSTYRTLVSNTRDSADEALYAAEEVPLAAVRVGYGIIPDTGGPGEFRGGATHYTDVQWMVPTRQSSTKQGLRQPPRGVYGGLPGALGGTWVWRSDEYEFDMKDPLPATLRDPMYAKSQPVIGTLDPSTYEVDVNGVYFSGERTVMAPAGSVVRAVNNGAGGWGDPLDRELHRVLRDVRDGYVTIEGAFRDYGVAVLGDPEDDPEGLTVDEASTVTERDRRRLERPRP